MPSMKPTVSVDLCADFHVYAYEWTADYISWSLDGMEIRRETGDIAAAYAQNVPNNVRHKVRNEIPHHMPRAARQAAISRARARFRSAPRLDVRARG